MIGTKATWLRLWIVTFWRKVQRNWKRTMGILFLLSTVGVAYFAVYQSDHVLYKFLLRIRETKFLPSKLKQEGAFSCEDLLKTARLLLDGEPIVLPFSKNKTAWQFKQTVPKELIKKNILFGENSTDWINFSNASWSEIKATTRTTFITFAHNCCARSKQRAVKKAKSVGGFDYVHIHNWDSMPPRFHETHKDVLKTSRGAGYWFWKPYILLKTLVENMNESDIVMYQDAGAYFIRSARPLLKLCEQSKEGIIVFSLQKMEHQNTKQDTFILMNMSFPEATDTFQRLASFVVLRKSCTSIQFIMEWLAYASDRRIISDDPNIFGIPNRKEFRAHRHDQSVLSLLSKKWGLTAYRDPSQYGEFVPKERYYSSGPYEQIILHDRLKQ